MRPLAADLIAGRRVVRNVLAIRWVQLALLVLFACLFASVTVILRWTITDSAFLGVRGWIPVSDAMGYFRCALGVGDPALLAANDIPADWCGRRILYPLSLLTMLSASSFSSALTLLMQAAIVGACIALSAIAVIEAFAKSVGLFVAALCAVFAYYWATGNFMTEFLGLSAGLVSASMLLFHASRKNNAIAVAGVAMLSVGLAGRTGALLVLPLVCAWCYRTMRPLDRPWHPFSLIAIVLAALFGPTLLYIGALQVGASPNSIGGNFAASLYGLSTGSRDWSESYRAFGSLFQTLPEAEAFRIVQEKALENIAARPRVFVLSLYGATSIYVHDLFGFVNSRWLNWTLTALLAIGTLRCFRSWRSPAMSLALAVFAGESLSAPFVIDTGGHRVLAATVWCRALLAGIGVWTCLSLLATVFGSHISSAAARVSSAGRATAWILSAVLTVLIVAPMTPLAGLMVPRLVQSRHACPTDQIPAIVDLMSESMAIGVATLTTLPLRGPLVVAPGRLEADVVLRAGWWGQQVGAMPSGSWVFSAFDRQSDSWGRLYSVFWQGEIPPSANGLYAICVGEVDKARRLGDFELRRLESIKPFLGD